MAKLSGADFCSTQKKEGEEKSNPQKGGVNECGLCEDFVEPTSHEQETTLGGFLGDVSGSC